MSTATLRLAILAATFSVPAALFAQAPAATQPPAATPAPATTAPATATQPAPAGAITPQERQNPPGLTPPSPPPPERAQGGTSGEGKGGGRRRGNFMPANPDATPVLPGQSPAAASGATSGAASGAKASGTGRTSRPQGGGMQRAFQSYQTKDEFEAYRKKVKSVKTVAECKALLESTRKELEPRAKAQNKSMDVDVAKICATGKERGRLTG